MAKTFSKIGVATGQKVKPFHVSQSIDAFTGIDAYDISLSGSFNMTGSINGEPGVINPLTASYAIFAPSASYAISALSASYAISASYEIIKEVSSSHANFADNAGSASYADTASFAQSGNGIFSGSFSGSFSGDGSGLTNVTASFIPVGLGGIYGGNGTVPLNTTASINGDFTFVQNSEKFRLDLDYTNGPEVILSTTQTDKYSNIIVSDGVSILTMGTIGFGWTGSTVYGNPGDSSIYSNTSANGVNIISAPGATTADYIRLYAGGNPQTSTASIHIDGDGSNKGYVGIGTETPNATLDVNGTTRHRDDVLIDNTRQIYWDDNTGVYPTSTNNKIRWDLNSDTAEIYAWQSSLNDIDFVFKVTDDAYTSADNYVFWIDNTNAVGGEANDRYPLEMNGSQFIVNAQRRYAVTGSNVSSSNVDFYVLNLGSSGITDSLIHGDVSTNRVGINKSNPEYTLDVNGTTNINGNTTITGSLTATGLTLGAGTNTVAMYDTGSGQFFYTASSAIGGGIDTNFANTDLTFTGTRTHDLSGNSLSLLNGGSITLSGSGIFNQIRLKHDTNTLSIQSARTAFNPGNADINFQVGTVGTDYALNVDGGTDRVSINKINPNATLDVNGDTIISGSTTIKNLGSTALNVIGSGSNNILEVNGSVGELLSVTDSNTGALFTVNNSASETMLQVNSDNTITYGIPSKPALQTTTTANVGTSPTVIYNIPTSSYTGAFVEYTITSESNARTGKIDAIWNAGTINFADVTGSGIGTTSGFTFAVILSGSNAVITGSASTTDWTVNAIIRSI